MSFLTSVFLWLIPLISIPLLIHLFNRRQLNTIDFSSIQFLKKIKKESIKKLNILHIILLIIRTLIILCIILMSTRPFIEGKMANWIDNSESTFTAIIIDNSYSTQREDNNHDIQKALDGIIASLSENSTTQIITSCEGEVYHGLVSQLSKINLNFNPTFKSSKIENISKIIDIKSKKYANLEVFVLTDSEGLNQIIKSKLDDISNDWNYYLYLLNPLSNNLSISNVTIKNKIILPDTPITLSATVNNNGISDVVNSFVQLIVNDVSVGQQSINLKSGETSTFSFTTAIPNNNNHFASIELQNDDRNSDNNFYFMLNSNARMNIALISNFDTDLTYLTNALDALNTKSNIYNYKIYNETTLSTLNANSTDLLFVIGNDISQNNKITSYINNLGTAIYFPSVVDTSFAPFKLDTDRSLVALSNGYQNLNFESIQSDQLRTIFTSNMNSDKRNVKFFKYFKTDLNSSLDLLTLNDSSTLLGKIQNPFGSIFYFTCAPSLSWSNLPIKGSFIPLLHFLLHENSNKQTSSQDFRLNELIDIKLNDKGQNLFFNVQDPYGSITKYPRNSASLMIDNASFPGYYTIRNDKNIEVDNIAVNIPDDELAYFDITKLKQNLSSEIVILANADEIEPTIQSARIGKELWRTILYLVISLVILEMLISNVHRKRS